MSYPRFASANVAGALVWGAGLTTLGNVASSVEWVKHLAYVVAGVAVLASLVVPLLVRMRDRRRSDQRSPTSDDEKADR